LKLAKLLKSSRSGFLKRIEIDAMKMPVTTKRSFIYRSEMEDENAGEDWRREGDNYIWITLCFEVRDQLVEQDLMFNADGMSVSNLFSQNQTKGLDPLRAGD